MSFPVPPEIRDDLRRAARLEYWTIGWMASIILVMGLAMGGSQAMRTAWIEDVLSLIPAIVFLVTARLERKPATRLYNYGFQRAHSLAFLIAAVALSAFGSLLFVNSVLALVKQEHVTVPPITLFGETFWMGWLMIAALVYSVIAPMILGRMKQPLAERLSDKVLHTDALMQRADWMTGLAGVAGIVGLGLGYWWADAAAAGFISLSIIRDGYKSLAQATAELVDGTPRALDSDETSNDAGHLRSALSRRFPGCDIRLRETGRYIRAQVSGTLPEEPIDLAEIWPGEPDRAWRFAQLSFVPPEGERREKDLKPDADKHKSR